MDTQSTCTATLVLAVRSRLCSGISSTHAVGIHTVHTTTYVFLHLRTFSTIMAAHVAA